MLFTRSSETFQVRQSNPFRIWSSVSGKYVLLGDVQLTKLKDHVAINVDGTEVMKVPKNQTNWLTDVYKSYIKAANIVSKNMGKDRD